MGPCKRCLSNNKNKNKNKKLKFSKLNVASRKWNMYNKRYEYGQ